MIHAVWLGATPKRFAWHGLPVTLHTDDSLLWPEWRPAYERYAKTVRLKSDFIRQSVLRRFGGLYIDADVRILNTERVLKEFSPGYAVAPIPRTAFLGTDIIHCQPDWPGWSVIDDYMRRDHRLGVLTFASDMLWHVYKTDSRLLTIVRHQGVASTPLEATGDSFVVRDLGARQGPGTHLKALLAKFGIHPTPTCSCNKMAQQMNEWGAEGCLTHIEEIVDVMGEEAHKRGLPFIRAAGRILVKKAIRNSRGNSQ